VLEEQRPTKRQMTQLADAFQVVSLKEKERQYNDIQTSKRIDDKGTNRICTHFRSAKKFCPRMRPFKSYHSRGLILVLLV
jgi:hypothetical protein